MQDLVLISRSDLDAAIRDSADAAAARVQRVPPVFTKKQVAAYLDKPISTVNRYMKEGMPYYKVDEKSYPEFYKPDIDAWLKRRFKGEKMQESEVVQ